MKTRKDEKQNTKSSSNAIIWIIVLILVASAIFADYYFANIAWAIKLAGWIILSCVLVFFILQTTQGKKIWTFAKEARLEMRKVVWPNRQETFRTTAIVISLVLLTAIIMWGADSIILLIIGWLTGQRG